MCHQASSLRHWLLSQAQQDLPPSLLPVAFWWVPAWLLPDSGQSPLTWFSWGPSSWAHTSCSLLLEWPFCRKTSAGTVLCGNLTLPPVLFRVALGQVQPEGLWQPQVSELGRGKNMWGRLFQLRGRQHNLLARGSRVLEACWDEAGEEQRENSFPHLERCMSRVLKPYCLLGHHRGYLGIKPAPNSRAGLKIVSAPAHCLYSMSASLLG